MNSWVTYVQERFFLPTLIVLVAGISLSGIFLNEGSFSLLPFSLSFIGIFFFFALMRLMDDVKDLEKDRIAHPDRPLARGLIKKPIAQSMVDRLQIFLFAYSLIVWVLLQEVAGFTFLCLAGYLWLMSRDFFAGNWLQRHPLIYGVLLQLFIFPVVFFSVAIVRSDALMLPTTWVFASLLFGAFFCYEICRKLDPHAHPVIASYVHFYGFRRTFEIATLTLALSAMSATTLNLYSILLPCEFLVLMSLVLLFFQQKRFKVPETLASLSLMLHVWAVVLFRFYYS
ncbi:MAG: hypothetical protein H0X29_00395 [Parachlamydiaceae bacterium]|nr:hypothetical protein [Parachlamydiaceae bacterium]